MIAFSVAATLWIATIMWPEFDANAEPANKRMLDVQAISTVEFLGEVDRIIKLLEMIYDVIPNTSVFLPDVLFLEGEVNLRRTSAQIDNVDDAMFQNRVRDLFLRYSNISITGSDRIYLKLQSICGSRRLFRVGAEKFGLGHRSLEIGDEVWLLAGSKLPFVLRKLTDDSKYIFIGEAYVDGMMFGDLWPARENDLVRLVLE